MKSTAFGLLGVPGQNAQKHVLVGRDHQTEQSAHLNFMAVPLAKEIKIDQNIVILIHVPECLKLQAIQVNLLHKSCFIYVVFGKYYLSQLIYRKHFS